MVSKVYGGLQKGILLVDDIIHMAYVVLQTKCVTPKKLWTGIVRKN
jgi:hypothetical protein